MSNFYSSTTITKYIFVGVVFCSVMMNASSVFAQFNQEINYQGKLTDDLGVTVTDANYDMVFRLYTISTGGSAIWTETRTSGNAVTVTNGLFSVMLGDISSLSAVDFDQTLYLGVTVGADSEMTPRKVLGAVPAAFEASHATTASDTDTLGGVASTSFLRSDQDDTASGLLTFSGGFISNSSSTITNLTTTIATTTTLVINGVSYTNLVGSGLSNSSGVLSTTLGTDITAAELADGDFGSFTVATGVATIDSDAITPDMVASGSQVDEYCLTYESSGDTWQWQDCSGGSTNLSDLADVDTTGVLTGALLIYNGASWATTSTSSLGINTDDLIEGSSLFYTDTLARAAISETITGLTYTSGTGVFSLDGSYSIPLTASTTAWNTFYDTPSNRITAGTGINWSSNTLNITGLTTSEFASANISQWTNDSNYLTSVSPSDLSLTNGYVFRGSSGNTAEATSSLFIADDGKVGIGTTTPGYLLHLYGDTNNGLLRIEDVNSGAGITFYNSVANPPANTNLGNLNYKGRDSAGNETPYTQILGYIATSTDGAEDGYLTFKTSQSGTLAEAMRIDENGRVGIGTSTMTHDFNVDGDSYFFGDLYIATSTGATSSGAIYMGRTEADGDEYIKFDPNEGTKGNFVFSAPLLVPGNSPAITFYDGDDPSNTSKFKELIYDPTNANITFSDAFVANFGPQDGGPTAGKTLFQIGQRTLNSQSGQGTFFGFNTPAAFNGDLAHLQVGSTTRFRVTNFGDVIVNSGTMTTNAPIFNTTQTWNNAATEFSAWRLNIIDTASLATSRLLDLQVGGVAQFVIEKDGAITTGSYEGSVIDEAYLDADVLVATDIGTNVQAYDADLTTYAGITPSANTQSLLSAASYAAMRTQLDLEAGTDFYSISAADSAFEGELNNSAGLLAALSDETGTGVAVFSTSPTLVTPILGTPSSVTLTNATGLPVSTGISGLGTGVATALAINVGTAGSFVTNGGALGTPSSGTLTNATGLPIVAGTTGTLSVARGGTGATSLTQGGILYGNGTGAVTNSGVLTNGQLLIGDGTTFPTVATLTQGTGITITNGAGSITIDSTLGTSVDISSETNLSVTATGLELSGDAVALTTGYTIPLTASTTEWAAASDASHSAVTLAGENYLSLSGQQITASAVNLSGTNVAGTLAAGRFPALTGDITTSAGSLTTAIASDVIDYTDILYTHTLAGNPAFGANETYFGTTGVIFEGATDDAFEGLLTSSVASSDKTWTLPNTTGTLITTGDSGTVTNTMLAGSIAASKLVGTDIATVGTITNGTWQGTAVTDTYVADAITVSGGTIGSNNISGTLTTTGSLAIGDGGDAITINGSTINLYGYGNSHLGTGANFDNYFTYGSTGSTYFRTYNGSTYANQMILSASGVITLAEWQGDAISSTYLDSSVILSTEIDSCSELAAITGTTGSCGSFVLSASPTLTGTITAAAANFSSTVNLAGANTSLTNASASLYFDSENAPDGLGFKRITSNDGGQNWGLRAGGYYSTVLKYAVTGDGYAGIRMNMESTSGAVYIDVAGTGTADATVTPNTLAITTSGVTFDGSTVWHAGNDGSGSTLDADLLDGANYDSGAATVNTVAGRNGSGDIFTRLIRSTYGDAASVNAGAAVIMRVNNSTDNYHRPITGAGFVDWLEGFDGAGTGIDSDLLDGQHGSYYQSASNLNAGTVASARIAGSYTGITGTGALNAGSITSGFGAIDIGASTFTTTGTANAGTFAAGTSLFTTYNSGNTDITGLVSGSNAGTLIRTQPNAQFVITLDGNDNSDSFNILSHTSTTGTGSQKAVDTSLLRILRDGTTTFSNSVTASSFSGSGASLTALNASQLTSGTVASARIAGSYTGITGVGTITAGTWQGSAIGTAYLDSSVILSTEIDTSAELAAIVTNETGSGALVFGTSPTITTPTISGTLTHTAVGNASVELGRTDGVASTPFIDFHSGATAVDYDARFIASGGTGASGGGTLSLTAGTFAVSGAITEGGSAVISAANIDTCSELAAITGTTGSCGSFVLSASPTLTGTITSAAMNMSSTLQMTGTAANIQLNGNYLSGDGGDEGISVDSSGNVTASNLLTVGAGIQADRSFMVSDGFTYSTGSVSGNHSIYLGRLQHGNAKITITNVGNSGYNNASYEVSLDWSAAAGAGGEHPGFTVHSQNISIGGSEFVSLHSTYIDQDEADIFLLYNNPTANNQTVYWSVQSNSPSNTNFFQQGGVTPPTLSASNDAPPLLSNNELTDTFDVAYNLNAAAGIDVTGNLTTTGSITATGEFISTTANQARFIAGNYGIIHRNDGSNYYILLTASGDQYGSWNALRPLSINNTTGLVSMANGLSVTAGNVSVTGSVTATTFSGSGASLTALNASQLTTGTIPDARIAGAYTDITNLTMSGVLITAGVSSRDKLRVWSSAPYSIGMQSAITYGAINNDYAMTFQMNDAANRGFWWGDATHTTAQGAMALSTDGKLSVAHSLRLGYGESDTTVPGATYRLDVSGATNITGTVTATTFSGSGASLTALPAAQLTGTVPSASIAGPYTGITGTGALNAGSITSGFGAIDIGVANFTTGGRYIIDVDGTAYNAAGAISLGAGTDAGIFFNGTDLQIQTQTAAGIVIDTEDDTLTINYSGVAGADFALDGLNLVTGDTYQINNVAVLSATALGSSVVSSSLTSVGALNSGSISSGFGNINIGASTFTTTGAVSTGALSATTGTFSGLASLSAGLTVDRSFMVSDGFSTSTGAVSGNHSIYLGRMQYGNARITVANAGHSGYNSVSYEVSLDYALNAGSNGEHTQFKVLSEGKSNGATEFVSLHSDWVSASEADIFLLYNNPTANNQTIYWSVQSNSPSNINFAQVGGITPPTLDSNNIATPLISKNDTTDTFDVAYNLNALAGLDVTGNFYLKSGANDIISFFNTESVGIGPDILFKTAGLIAAEDDFYINIDSNNSTTGADFSIRKDAQTSAGTLLFSVDEVGVGYVDTAFLVGTTSRTNNANLEVWGAGPQAIIANSTVGGHQTLRFLSQDPAGDAQIQFAYGTDNDRGEIRYDNGNASMDFRVHNIEIMNITTGGINFEFTNNAGASNLCWDGTGVSLWGACTSLQKYKDNTIDLGLGLETLMALRPVEFDWNELIGAEGHDLGFIAEEVEAVSPLLAEYGGEGGTLSGVKYSQMSSLITATIQDIVTILDVSNASTTQTALTVDALGNITIGTSTDQTKLTTYGAVQFANFGAGTLQTDALGNLMVSSDERLKDIDGEFIRGLDALLGIEPIQYHWKDKTGFDTKGTYTGFSAQNIEAFIPEAVSYDKNGFRTLSDRPLLATVINAVKELWEVVTQLRDKVTGFDQQVKTEQLCVGNTCINEAQLIQLLQQQGQTGGSPSSGGSSSAPTPTEPVVEEDPVVDGGLGDSIDNGAGATTTDPVSTDDSGESTTNGAGPEDGSDLQDGSTSDGAEDPVSTNESEDSTNDGAGDPVATNDSQSESTSNGAGEEEPKPVAEEEPEPESI